MRYALLCCAVVGALALTAWAAVACTRATDTAKSTTSAEAKGTAAPSRTTEATVTTAPATDSLPPQGSFETISQERTKSEMDALTAEGKPFVLLDVRRLDEYNESHIAGALLLPNESIGTERPEELPDLSVPLYVDCRSGRRSLEAAKKLAAMGYTVYDFGGIIDWQYGTVG